jgi:uncharacterized protein (DUF302 family)
VTSPSHELVTKPSPRSVTDTVARITDLVAANGLTLFAVIDHRAGARSVGLDLPETTVVIFGSPTAGTALMAAAPLAALDLPLKVLVWADGDQTMLAYAPPSTLATRYGLSEELADRLAGIHAITDAAIAP